MGGGEGPKSSPAAMSFSLVSELRALVRLVLSVKKEETLQLKINFRDP